MNNLRKLIEVTALILGMTLASSVFAQANLALTTIKINPFTDGEFSQAVVKLREAMDESDTPFYWLVAESQSGEANFLFAQPYDSYSVMDVNVDAGIGSALNTDELGEFVANLQSSITSISTARYVARPDLSRTNPEPSEGVPDAVITINLDIANGGALQFEALMRQVIEATDATAPNVYWETYSPAFGTNDYLVVALVDEWENLDTPAKSVRQRLIEHFGERRGARMMDDSNAYVLDVQNNLYRTRPDISRPPPAE